MAPEIFISFTNDNIPKTKSDIWNLGIILLEMFINASLPIGEKNNLEENISEVLQIMSFKSQTSDIHFELFQLEGPSNKQYLFEQWLNKQLTLVQGRSEDLKSLIKLCLVL